MDCDGNLDTYFLSSSCFNIIQRANIVIKQLFSANSATAMAISSDKQPSIDHQLLRLPEDKTLEEATLEKEGCFATLQRYRYNLYQLNRNRGVYDGIVSFLEVEQLLRSNAQKEVELKQILGKQSFIWNMLNTMALERLKKRNWSLHRDWWYWSGYIVGRSGLLKRAFELWRSHPMWYMHPALVEDCIGRGGCCGRTCGCCVGPQRANSSAGQLGVGHCTLDCGCCSSNREFKLSSTQQEEYRDSFGFYFESSSELGDDEDDDEKEEKEDINNTGMFSPYKYCYYLASIWGISMDDPKCPACSP